MSALSLLKLLTWASLLSASLLSNDLVSTAEKSSIHQESVEEGSGKAQHDMLKLFSLGTEMCHVLNSAVIYVVFGFYKCLGYLNIVAFWKEEKK